MIYHFFASRAQHAVFRTVTKGEYHLELFNHYDWESTSGSNPTRLYNSRAVVSTEPTCQHMCGAFLSSTYCVSGEGSSSYLSKGSLSITMGSQSAQEKRTTGWAERGGWGPHREGQRV